MGENGGGGIVNLQAANRAGHFRPGYGFQQGKKAEQGRVWEGKGVLALFVQ